MYHQPLAIPPPHGKSFVTGQVLVHPFILKLLPDGPKGLLIPEELLPEVLQLPKVEPHPDWELWFVAKSPSSLKLYDPVKQFNDSKTSKDVQPPYLEFANLDPENPQQLLEYANTHGIPPSQVYDGQVPKGISIPSPYPIKKFRQEISKMRLFLEVKAIVAGDQSLKETPKFDSILSNLKALLIDRVTKKLHGKRVKETINEISKREEFAAMLFSLINFELKGVSLRINARPGQKHIFERTFQFSCLLQALYTTLAEDIASPIQKCADPKCGEFFLAHHQGKMYCSPQCGVRVANRNSYRRKKEGKRESQASDTSHKKREEIKHGKKKR